MIDTPQPISVILQAVIQGRAATTLRDVRRRRPVAPDLPAVAQPLCRRPDVRHPCGQCRARPPHKIRTDLTLTLFLSDPADYDGGELTVEDTCGLHRIKLPAGLSRDRPRARTPAPGRAPLAATSGAAMSDWKSDGMARGIRRKLWLPGGTNPEAPPVRSRPPSLE